MSASCVWRFLSFVLLPAILAIPGCVVTQDVYLQDISLEGPLNTPPVRLAPSVRPEADSMEQQIRITPRFTYSNDRRIAGRVDRHTLVNAAGFYQVDTAWSGNEAYLRETPGANTNTFRGTNFSWRLPSSTLGIDVEYPLSRGVSLTGGIMFAELSSNAFWGWNAGIGVHSVGQAVAIRFDAGLQWSTYSYDVLTVVRTTTYTPFGTSERIGFFRDRGKNSHLGYAMALTVHTAEPTWLVDPFLSLTLSRHPTIDYRPTRFLFTPTTAERDAELSLSAISYAAGVSISLAHRAQFLAGARWVRLYGLLDRQPASIFTPVLQVTLSP